MGKFSISLTASARATKLGPSRFRNEKCLSWSVPDCETIDSFWKRSFSFEAQDTLEDMDTMLAEVETCRRLRPEIAFHTNLIIAK
jgi:hypothetical protein